MFKFHIILQVLKGGEGKALEGRGGKGKGRVRNGKLFPSLQVQN